MATRVIVVAKEKGNDDFITIQDAINAVPANNTKFILIRVKPGIYREKVTIPLEKPFLILNVSGANNTIITWNDSAKSSGGTYYSGTVSVFASDFMARYITIQNSYGPGDQAVALRISGDRSSFYGCSFLGYQDTVLDESGKHYFSNCFIEGATDIVDGNKAETLSSGNSSELLQLQNQIEVLEKKLVEKEDELLKSAKSSTIRMEAMQRKVEELQQHILEKDSLILTNLNKF